MAVSDPNNSCLQFTCVILAIIKKKSTNIYNKIKIDNICTKKELYALYGKCLTLPILNTFHLNI